MDPVSAIVGALVAGVLAAAKDVASKAVSDAYNGLKSLIVTRFKRKAPIEAIEEAPESESARAALGGALTETGADRDPEVMRLAQTLTEALKAIDPNKLESANIKIGDVEGYRDAIVRGLTASGSVTVDHVKALRGDAVVEQIQAGLAPKKL